MAYYTHFHRKGNSVFVRWIDDQGVRRTKVVRKYEPTLYIRSNEETGWWSLHGDPVKPIEFDSIKEARDFLQQYEGVDGFDIFGNTNWEYDCINKMFPHVIKGDQKQLRIFYIDIETEVGDTFPDPHLANQRINVVTIFDGSVYRVWTFNPTKIEPEYDGHQVDLRVFKDEDAMLRDMIRFWSSDYPDIITAWNSTSFDIPYIINRIRNQLGADHASRLSPVGSIGEKKNRMSNLIEYDIQGIEHLDYLLLFKKFMPGERDFSLDAVAEDFLHENKLENPESSFKKFYENHWDTFLLYNIHDVGLVKRLDDKLRFISLAMAIAYMSKTNYTDSLGTVKVWDAFIQNYLYADKKLVPATFDVKTPDRQIAGGFVADPKAGRYDWLVSFDANSLYPSLMRTFNISPETILSMDEVPEELMPFYDKIHTKLPSELPELLKKHGLTMTMNGQFFRTDSQGIIPKLAGLVYNQRVQTKNEMKVWKKRLQELKDQLKAMDEQG